MRTMITLKVDSPADEALQDPAKRRGARFSIALKSGERMAATVVSVERKVGRKRGLAARYWLELEGVSATPEFFNHGDPTRVGTSQN